MSDLTVKKKRAATVTRRYGGVDAVERRRERQRKLLDAGLEVFGTRGFHLSTVRDICTQAGLSERYFYESFKSSAALFDAVYGELRSDLQQRVMASVIAQGMSQADVAAMGECSLRAWYVFLHEDVRRARIMLIDAISVGDNGVRVSEATVTEFKQLLLSFVSRMYPEMATLGYELDVLVSGLAGATIYIAKNWTQSGFKQPLDEVIKHNVLIFHSMDAVYRQLLARQADPRTGERVALPRAPLKKGRRATDN